MATTGFTPMTSTAIGSRVSRATSQVASNTATAASTWNASRVASSFVPVTPVSAAEIPVNSGPYTERVARHPLPTRCRNPSWG